MNDKPRPRLCVQERQKRLMDAIRAYGAFDVELTAEKPNPDWLITHFVMAWFEAWHKHNWALMTRYLSDAESILFDRLFGAGLVTEKTPADERGSQTPDVIEARD